MILMCITSEKVILQLILVFPKSIRFIFTPHKNFKLYNLILKCKNMQNDPYIPNK